MTRNFHEQKGIEQSLDQFSKLCYVYWQGRQEASRLGPFGGLDDFESFPQCIKFGCIPLVSSWGVGGGDGHQPASGLLPLCLHGSLLCAGRKGTSARGQGVADEAR